MSLALKTYKPEMSEYAICPFGKKDGGADYLAFMIRHYLSIRHDDNFDAIDKRTLHFMISEMRIEKKRKADRLN